MLVRGRCRHPAPRRAHEQPALDEKGLVDVLDRLGLLTNPDRKCRQSDGPAAELLADRGENRPSLKQFVQKTAEVFLRLTGLQYLPVRVRRGLPAGWR